MNQSVLLHIIERLEAFLGKLPASIQKPVLHELTPLKELFLQQHAPRFVITGPAAAPMQEFVPLLFGARVNALRDTLIPIHRWHTVAIDHEGKIEVLDARGADDAAMHAVEEELRTTPADVVLYVSDGSAAEGDLSALRRLMSSGNPKVVGIALRAAEKKVTDLREHLREVAARDLLTVVSLTPSDSGEQQRLLSLLARELPNSVRIELARISRDRQVQSDIASLLVKSTAAICTAIGAQPIPLADLPILTTLQLAMVSGIMYISGRERSLRAATEFVGALGVNVGAGMVLREGARAALKFFPGWGNVICGMVAGAGTYAIGKAATVFFVEGVTVKQARKTYLTSRKRRATTPALPQIQAAGRSTKNGASRAVNNL